MVRNFFIFFTVLVQLQIFAKVEALSCYQCNSNDEPKCLNSLKELTPEKCVGDKLKYCVTSVENAKVTRTCAELACNTNDCQSSDKDDSNTHNICQTCSSSNDAKCAQSSTALATFNKVCAVESTKCVISIKDKNTERRCATADDEKSCTDTDTKSCKSCTGVNCNVGIFPTNRLRCYQCDSSQTADAKCNTIDPSQEGLKAQVCQLYESEDKCYTIGNSETTMKRGCVSDNAEKGNKCSATNADAECATCNKDECNNQNYMRDQSLMCIQCKTSGDDQKCGLEQNLEEAKNCKKKILYNKKEMCYTETKNGIVERGCLHDREGDSAKCERAAGCYSCEDTKGCNKNVSGFTCIICRSDQNSNCSDHADKISGSNCRNEATKPEQIGCFHGKWNGVVIRGCLADADERVQATCTNPNNTQCISCQKNDCNNSKTSSAPVINASASLFLLAIVFVLGKF